MVVSAIRSRVIDDIAYSIVDMYLKKHSFVVLDNRLLSNLKGELDAVNVLRDIWLDQMGGSPELLIASYEKTNDQNGTQHYENLIDSTIMTFVAEFFVALFAGIVEDEFSKNRDKILDRIRRLYRKPIPKLLEETESITSKYDKPLRYLFQVYALKEYSEKNRLSLAEFISLREDIRANVYSDKKKTLPESFVGFYNAFLETHLLPNLEQNYAQNMGIEFVTLSLDRNFNDYIRDMALEKTQDSLHEKTMCPLLEKVLQGISAGKRGTAIGNVVIVIDEDDCKSVQKGNVMVVDEMCPDFVPAARCATALISNKGGITSHTAVIGRALNIPTVVGTEKATKYLKNGQEVMVDSRRGIIFRILKDF